MPLELQIEKFTARHGAESRLGECIDHTSSKVAPQTSRVAITNIGGEISAYYCAVVGLLCIVVPEITVMKTSHAMASAARNIHSCAKLKR